MKKFKKSCCFCEKSFGLQSQLVVHIRQHTGEKPFECEHCHKAFASLKVLKVHERIHTGERPYKCSFCEKCFSAYANLVVHKRIHTNEKPYQCKLCKRAFEHSGNLNRHFRAHMTDYGFRCILCTKLFAQDHEILEHTKTEHKNEFLNYIMNDPEYKDSLLKENKSFKDSSNSSHSQLPSSYEKNNNSKFENSNNIKNININIDNNIKDNKLILLDNNEDNVINSLENINPALNVKSENLTSEYVKFHKLGKLSGDTQRSSTSNQIYSDRNSLKTEKFETDIHKFSNDNSSFNVKNNFNSSLFNQADKLRRLKVEEQNFCDEKVQMLFDPPPLIPIEDVENLEMEYETTNKQFPFEEDALSLQEHFNSLKCSKYERTPYEHEKMKHPLAFQVQNCPSTSSYPLSNQHTNYLQRENSDVPGDQSSIKQFLMSEFQKYAFKKKVEKLLVILFGKTKLKEYKYPQKSCEQVNKFVLFWGLKSFICYLQCKRIYFHICNRILYFFNNKYYFLKFI